MQRRIIDSSVHDNNRCPLDHTNYILSLGIVDHSRYSLPTHLITDLEHMDEKCQSDDVGPSAQSVGGGLFSLRKSLIDGGPA